MMRVIDNKRGPSGRGISMKRERGEGDKKKPLTVKLRAFSVYLPDDNLLSHWLQHYHRRNVVSRSCSGWEGVVPTCYGHQA